MKATFAIETRKNGEVTHRWEAGDDDAPWPTGRFLWMARADPIPLPPGSTLEQRIRAISDAPIYKDIYRTDGFDGETLVFQFVETEEADDNTVEQLIAAMEDQS